MDTDREQKIADDMVACLEMNREIAKGLGVARAFLLFGALVMSIVGVILDMRFDIYLFALVVLGLFVHSRIRSAQEWNRGCTQGFSWARQLYSDKQKDES